MENKEQLEEKDITISQNVLQKFRFDLNNTSSYTTLEANSIGTTTFTYNELVKLFEMQSISFSRLNCFLIEGGSYNAEGRAMITIPRVLIDNGYIKNNLCEPNHELTIFIRNDCNHPTSAYVRVTFTCFLFTDVVDKYPEVLNKDMTLFESYSDLDLYAFDAINRLRRQNIGDNSIDIEFKQNYSIEPKGHIKVTMKTTNIKVFNNWPFLFILRSRFARAGARIDTVSFMDGRITIVVANDSNLNAINLGDRFLSILLPPSLLSPEVVEKCAKRLAHPDIPVVLKDKTKAVKPNPG